MLPPREVVALAAERGLAGIALTDHDTTNGIAEAQGMAQSLGIRCIAGVELSCSGPAGNPIHLLGYCIDPEHAGLQAMFASMRRERLERADAIVVRIRELGGEVTMDDVLREAGDAPAGRPHIARAMIGAGLITDIDEAFTPDWFGPGGRAFVSRDGVQVADAIQVIHDAGGVAVFAHPGARTKDGFREEAIREAATAGLDGVEADHPSHEGDIVRRISEVAIELGLVQTAGSDDHGYGIDGSRLGCRTVPQRIVDALDARAQARRGSGRA
jgi:predicted metal-dependent phosphoesterase TrpH